MKTADLTGAALDWAVAKAEGFDALAYEQRRGPWRARPASDMQPRAFLPSADWAQGGPIVEREHINVHWAEKFEWEGRKRVGDNYIERFGDTPLIAAMRCYVASKLGNEVEVPKELL